MASKYRYAKVLCPVPSLYCLNLDCKQCKFGVMLDLEQNFTQGNRKVRNSIASVASK